MTKCLMKLVVVIFVLAPLSASAAQKEDAIAMVERAIAYIEQHGMEKTKTEIKNRDGEFISGELYVFIMDIDGRMISHGLKDRLDNKILLKLKTLDGVYYIQEMVNTVKRKGSGWVDYVWAHPETGKVVPKSTYVKGIMDNKVFVACGVYPE